MSDDRWKSRDEYARWSLDDVVAMESLIARIKRSGVLRRYKFGEERVGQAMCHFRGHCRYLDCPFAHNELELDYFKAVSNATRNGLRSPMEEASNTFNVDIQRLADRQVHEGEEWGYRGRRGQNGKSLRGSFTSGSSGSGSTGPSSPRSLRDGGPPRAPVSPRLESRDGSGLGVGGSRAREGEMGNRESEKRRRVCDDADTSRGPPSRGALEPAVPNDASAENSASGNIAREPVFIRQISDDKYECRLCETGPMPHANVNSHKNGKKHKANIAQVLSRRRGESASPTLDSPIAPPVSPPFPAPGPFSSLDDCPSPSLDNWLDRPLSLGDWANWEDQYVANGGVDALAFKVVRDLLLSPTLGVSMDDLESLRESQKRTSVKYVRGSDPEFPGFWEGELSAAKSKQEEDLFARLDRALGTGVDPFHDTKDDSEVERSTYALVEKGRDGKVAGMGYGRFAGVPIGFRIPNLYNVDANFESLQVNDMPLFNRASLHDRSVLLDETFLNVCIPVVLKENLLSAASHCEGA